MQAPSSLETSLHLDAGETEAISLALELDLPGIRIDERDGRSAAQERGLSTLGTLAILDLAALRGLLDFANAVERLRRTNFRVAQDILDALLREVRARKAK